MTSEELKGVLSKHRDDLADLCHKQWSGWMGYLFTKGHVESHIGFVLNADSVERWRRQMVTPFKDLSEPEKESDRKEADKFITLLSSLVEKEFAIESNNRTENDIQNTGS